MKLVLYGTAGCHLCEEAEQIIAMSQIPAPALAGLALVDIADDEALLEQYGVLIPVLRDSETGRELRWPFDRQAVLAFLQAAVTFPSER